MPVTPNGSKRDISQELADHRLAEQGQRYWSDQPTSTGKVAGIGYGRPGDFAECVARVTPHLGAGAKGYCAERHHQATGFWPGHAPGESGR